MLSFLQSIAVASLCHHIAAAWRRFGIKQASKQAIDGGMQLIVQVQTPKRSALASVATATV